MPNNGFIEEGGKLLWDDNEVPNLHCGDCKYFKVNADMDQIQSTCKRIDHKKIQFGRPWFKSYDCHQFSGCICSDFEPNPVWKDLYNHWINFSDYWPNYVEQWLPYKNVNILISFFVNKNTDISYMVNLMDFVNGTMLEGNKLNAIEKVYYKRDKEPNGFGYKLIREPIDGINIK